MCDKCEVLIKCPVGESRHIELLSAKNDEGDHGTVTIAIDRAEKDDAFITTEVIMGGKYSNLPIDICYCPFCGEKLKGE